jgi:hypothetical protein
MLCVAGIGVRAQTGTSTATRSADAYWNIPLTTEQKLQSVLVESQTVIPDPAAGLNSLVIQQDGAGNRATLQAITGSQNRLEAVQTGNGNGADAMLSGTNNSLIINQMGGGNAVNVDLAGNGNRYMLTQDGGDTANLYGLQKDNSQLELRQGSGNNSFTIDNSSLFKDPLSTGIPNLRIEQAGGASITVQQGRAIGN